MQINLYNDSYLEYKYMTTADEIVFRVVHPGGVKTNCTKGSYKKLELMDPPKKILKVGEIIEGNGNKYKINEIFHVNNEGYYVVLSH